MLDWYPLVLQASVTVNPAPYTSHTQIWSTGMHKTKLLLHHPFHLILHLLILPVIFSNQLSWSDFVKYKQISNFKHQELGASTQYTLLIMNMEFISPASFTLDVHTRLFLNPVPEGILINPYCSQMNSVQSHLLPKKFWPIPTAHEGILSSPTHSRRNSDQSLLLPKEYWPVPPSPEGILTSPALARRIYCLLVWM